VTDERDDSRRVPVEDAFDLHSFLPGDIHSALDEYLREARSSGFEEVRIIHGKGTGAARAHVRQILSAHPGVIRYADAPPERGGMGATIVRIRPAEAENGDES
jgi:dsDNA-specific endonuclease/ATPase MutS2